MKQYLKKGVVLAAILSSTQLTQAQTNGMTLNEVLQRTAEGNRQLQIKAMELTRTDEMVKEARSYLLPSVRFNTSYTAYPELPVIYLRNESSQPKANDTKYGGRLAFDANITASYALTNPVARTEIRSAVLQKEIEKKKMRLYEEQLAMEVSQLHFTVLFYEQQKTLLLQSLSRNDQALNDSKNLFLQGKNLRTDTLSLSISVQNIRLAIASLENQIRISKLHLMQLMGIESDTDLPLKDSEGFDDEMRAWQGSRSGLELARQSRADIALANLGIEQSKLGLQRTRSLYKPQFFAFAQYQVQSQADDYQFRYYSFPRTSFAGVKLSIPVYSGNRLKYQSASASINIKQEQLALADLDSKVQTTLTALNLKFEDEKKQWAIQKQTVDAAAINYNMAYERYRAGLSSRLELNDAELSLTRAKLEESRLRYSVQLLFIELKKQMGILKLTNE